jgi:hypothetical protein
MRSQSRSKTDRRSFWVAGGAPWNRAARLGCCSRCVAIRSETKLLCELNASAGDETPNGFRHLSARHLRPLESIHDRFRKLLVSVFQTLENRCFNLCDDSIQFAPRPMAYRFTNDNASSRSDAASIASGKQERRRTLQAGECELKKRGVEHTHENIEAWLQARLHFSSIGESTPRIDGTRASATRSNP